MLRYIYCITQHTILLLKGQVASQFHFSLTELLIITCDMLLYIPINIIIQLHNSVDCIQHIVDVSLDLSRQHYQCSFKY